MKVDKLGRIETITQMERRIIVKALNKTKGKMTEALKLLAPTGHPCESSIYKKIHSYGISQDYKTGKYE